jgi:hypothetical protein
VFAVSFINLLTLLTDFYAIIPGRYTGRIYPVGRKKSSIYPAQKHRVNTTVSGEQRPSTGVRGRNENAVVTKVKGKVRKDPQ